MAANTQELKGTVDTNIAFTKGQTSINIKNQPINNGIIKPVSIITSVKSENEKSIKMDLLSANLSNATNPSCNIVKNYAEDSILERNNSSLYQKSNDCFQQDKKIQCEDEKMLTNQLNDSQKVDMLPAKIITAPSHKENIPTIDIRDLRKVFQQSEEKAVSGPPVPLRKKTYSNSSSSSRDSNTNESVKNDSSADIKKSTSSSNVSTYLSKKYQDLKQKSGSFRYLTPTNSGHTVYSTTSLNKSNTQYNKLGTDSIKPYSIEKSLEILKSPSAKINNLSSSTYSVPKSVISKTETHISTEKITDNKLASQSNLNKEQTAMSQMSESEIPEKIKSEKQALDLRTKFSQIKNRNESIERNIVKARSYFNDLNGDSYDNDETNSIYRQKYERIVKELEMTKKQMQQQHEEDLENQLIIKKACDKKLAEAVEDLEEEKRVSTQWKRKAQKANNELQDQRLLIEEQITRNAEFEKMQHKFDVELNNSREEISKERFLREKIEREKDAIQREKYSLEQELHSIQLDGEMQAEKIVMLHKELEEISTDKCGEEITLLKRMKQELERKYKEQEEEREDLTSQLQMSEQAKLRLEMSLEKVKQEHGRELSVKEEEIEETRAAMHKKVKNLESQLENEQEERQKFLKQKYDLERRIIELSDQPSPHDPGVERRLRRELKRTKALLQDSQIMLEHIRNGQANKSIIRQLKNQIEEAEFMKTASIKAKQCAETELQDVQLQLEDMTRIKCDIESQSLQLSRENSALRTQVEEIEEELAEVMKKYKAVVQQMSSDQKLLADQNEQISELETEKKLLKEQLSDLSHKIEQINEQPTERYKILHLEGKICELETKLEFELSTHSRLENQLHRLKEQYEKMKEECDTVRTKEFQSQECIRRLQRQQRELREDYSSLQMKESEAYQKYHELEMALENAEADIHITRNDLKLAYQRIQDLQHALEDDVNSETDIAEDSGSESDGSISINSVQSHQYYGPMHCFSGISNCDGSYETLNVPHTSSFGQDYAFNNEKNVEDTDEGERLDKKDNTDKPSTTALHYIAIIK